ncbi:AraC family transcriptional regulator [Paractinoplanes rishiriensis]|uniref:AraC family transcriptional regulator n=1 Tax=Paractinoplanes rishiriensis TaxID=1050105 RepID=A0A919KA18_9ACTN|nr:AraC family transcriptional regulator [Actinoplanes rishiriensis]GIF01465.1 AraC family transcriptional regulator [Actinoplanes rishiriensis]
MSADDRKRNALEVYRLGMGQFEELVDTVDQLIFPVRWRAPQAVRRLPVAFTGIRLGGVTIGTAAVSGEVSALTTERGSYHVVMTTAGSVRSEHRANRVLVTPDRAAVYLPDGFTTASWAGPETCPMSVTIEPAVLHEELAGHLGHPISRPIELATSMSTADGMGRTWAALVRLIYDETTGESPSLACHPLIRSRLYDAVVSGLLLAADHQYREELFSPVPPMRPRAVRKAIDLLEAYPHQHLPVTTLARAVGVSTRTLQGGFRQHLGMTPMAYARSVRLARAHRDLQEADPQRTTVAAIAHRWGFSHLSRFAATYRNIYGTAPSKTLRS